MDTNIGMQIRRFRSLHGWSQATLAEQAGLSPTYIGMLERGEKLPKLETLFRLAELLGATVSDLLSENDAKITNTKILRYADALRQRSPEEQERIFVVLDALLFG